MKKQIDIVDQELLLDDAQTKVLQNSSLMKAALETNNLREALKSASSMVSELKNPLLTPKYYYILCIRSAI